MDGTRFFTSDRILVEGGPPPQMSFGIILLAPLEDLKRIKQLAGAVSQALLSAGFEVHKGIKELGARILALRQARPLRAKHE